MSVNRRRVLYLVLPGTGLGALAFLLLTLPLGLSTGPADAAPWNVSLVGILIYLLGVFGGGALLLAGWILALAQMEHSKQWGWFGLLLAAGSLLLVLALVTGSFTPWAFPILPLILILYTLVGPSAPQPSIPTLSA
jgi:hypothetical protein